MLAIGLVYLLQNTQLLQASILSISDYTTIKENNRDMAYKTENNRIEVFCSDTIATDIQEIKIHLVYNDVNINRPQADYQSSINIDTPVAGETYVILNNIQDIDCTKSLIDVAFEGEYDNIIVNTITNDGKSMKIGNLNTITKHG